MGVTYLLQVYQKSVHTCIDTYMLWNVRFLHVLAIFLGKVHTGVSPLLLHTTNVPPSKYRRKHHVLTCWTGDILCNLYECLHLYRLYNNIHYTGNIT